MEWIKPLGPACRRCAHPLPEDLYLLCGSCIKTPPHFDRAWIAYAYEEPLRTLLHQFKYQKGLYLHSFLCELMLQALQKTQAQCLIPVPMYPKKIRQRGFNQAAVLAKTLAKKLQLPYDLIHCKKIIHTPAQAHLDHEQRQKNLRKAFHSQPLPYQHVLLIDDLLTTGSTASEVALSLKKAGVKTVDICCCARATMLDHGSS